MKLSTKQIRLIITILILFLIGLSVMIFFFWQSTHRPIPVTNDVDNFNDLATTNNEPVLDVPSLSPQQIAANPYLAQASAILQQITSKADEYGFYGVGQICPTGSNGADCSLAITPGSDRANWREGLAVIYGRYQYYLATGDEQQRHLLIQDIDNLVTKIMDVGGYLLQSGSFNCLWMEPLIDSPYLPVKTKQQASRICLESPFEYAPNSSVASDQHRHHLYTITDGADSNSPTIGVTNLYPESDTLTTYEVDDLTAHLSQNLRQAAAGGDISTFSPVAPENQLQYLNRELMASLDQLAAMRIAQAQGNNIADKAAQLHYLLLTDETLFWYHQNQPQISPEDKCLLSVSLNYFLENFAHGLTVTELMTLANLYRVDNPGVMCSFARLAVSSQPADLAYLHRYLSDINPPSWTGGGLLLASHTDDYLFRTDLNGVLAGLFSQKEFQQ